MKRCLDSILQQSAYRTINCEVCVCNDASTDQTLSLLKEWETILLNKNIPLKIFDNQDGTPGGGTYNNFGIYSSLKSKCFSWILKE